MNALRCSNIGIGIGTAIAAAALVVPAPAIEVAADESMPVGVIAIGHSGLTGENSDPERPGADAPSNSWATGTNPDVGSVYRRLAAALPETDGHVANAARGGAPASSLVSQAETALEEVPAPALVIIQTLDNEIRCDGTDAEHVDEFGTHVAAALDVITTASPRSRILVVGQLGRPSPAFVTELVAAHPWVQPSLTGPAPCGFYDTDGNIVDESFEALTAIIEGYEAEQSRVCATVPNCWTDGGARAAYVDELENFSGDFNHLNVAGNARAAEIIWPVVVDIFELEAETATSAT